MRIILLGAPGSGKGTQGDLITRKYGFVKISSGDLLRKAASDNTPLGRETEDLMKRGDFVSDDVVIGMIKERIKKEDCLQGFILDGFPRSLSQALAFERMSPDENEVVLDIHLDDKVVVDRISARRICSGCSHIFNINLKEDDQKDLCEDCGGTIRLKVYHDQNEALVGFYKEKNVYVCVEGDAKIEDIFENICIILDEKLAHTHKNNTNQ